MEEGAFLVGFVVVALRGGTWLRNAGQTMKNRSIFKFNETSGRTNYVTRIYDVTIIIQKG